MASSAEADENLRRAVDLVRRAGDRGAQVVCLPELFRTQYFCQREEAALFDLAEPVPGPTTERLAQAARESRVAVAVSVFEKRAAGLYHNSVALLGPDGRLLGLYRKMHIPDDPLYYEKFYFTPGDLGYKVFTLPAAGFRPSAAGSPLPPPNECAPPPSGGALRVGTLICWDQWYPEAARLTALMGAQLLLYPTAIGWHPAEKSAYGAAQLDAWRTIQRAHAIANGVYVAAVNRVGHETGDVMGTRARGAGLEFWGHSFLCDPLGQIIAEGAADREEVLIGEVDLGRLEDVRRNWPFFRDRRIDSYGKICQRLIDHQ
jgi:N-carbamoylputrescine amidase